MTKLVSAAAVATLALALGACQTGQDDPAALNKQYANSKVYIGALSCNVSGSTGYVFASTKDLSCVYVTKDGAEQAYDGKIRKFGLDIGYTKAGHLVWHVYQLAGLVGDKTTINPKILAGNYGGEQASISADASAGGETQAASRLAGRNLDNDFSAMGDVRIVAGVFNHRSQRA